MTNPASPCCVSGCSARPVSRWRPPPTRPRRWRLLKKERFDLLLVDIRMPEISGFDVVQRARETQNEMAILAMTGFGTVETAIQALRRGVDGLILKPFEKDELIQAVRQALQDSQQKQDAARVQALRPLFSITETLLSETRPDHLLELILDVVSAMRCANVGFYQVIERENRLNLLAGRGKLLPDGAISENGNPVARAAALETPVWGSLNDPRLKRDLYPLELSSLMSRADLASVNLLRPVRGARCGRAGLPRGRNWRCSSSWRGRPRLRWKTPGCTRNCAPRAPGGTNHGRRWCRPKNWPPPDA